MNYLLVNSPEKCKHTVKRYQNMMGQTVGHWQLGVDLLCDHPFSTMVDKLHTSLLTTTTETQKEREELEKMVLTCCYLRLSGISCKEGIIKSLH